MDWERMRRDADGRFKMGDTCARAERHGLRANGAVEKWPPAGEWRVKTRLRYGIPGGIGAPERGSADGSDHGGTARDVKNYFY